MRIIFLGTITIFWLITTSYALLDNVYLWQLKEYRLDRMIDYFRTGFRKRLLTVLLWSVFLGVLTFFPSIGIGLLFYLAIYTLGLFWLKRIRRPVLTSKAILLLIGSCGILGFILLSGLIIGELWMVLWPSDEVFTVDMLNTITLFVIVRLSTPFAVITALIGLYFPSEIAKRMIIKRASDKVSKLQPKNVIGITGSYGKTSTKYFLSTILEYKYKVFQTSGGTNINIAIAQQILDSLEPDHEQMVIEMGAYRKGEIASICRVVNPNIGIWTAINEQHLSLFGSVIGTIQAKYELIAALPENGTAIVNGDDKLVMSKISEWPGKKIVYSKENHSADVIAKEVQVFPEKLCFVLEHQNQKEEFEVNILGEHNLSNILASISCALELGMCLSEISDSVNNIKPIEGTMSIQRGENGLIMIDSTFSSNPDGTKAAVDYLRIFDKRKKIVLFPGIIELGEATYRIHVELGESIAKVCDVLFIVNDDFVEPILEGVQKAGNEGFEVIHGISSQQIQMRLQKQAVGEAVILFEGRGTKRYLQTLLCL
jgi:UDP-N-acetylmuramoyl-tripeptide--D-alanyl-D-alanine ligase